MEAREDVNVIFDASDTIKVRLFVFDDAPNVTEQMVSLCFDQAACAIFRREHDVIINLGVGGHMVSVLTIVQPLSGLIGLFCSVSVPQVPTCGYSC